MQNFYQFSRNYDDFENLRYRFGIDGYNPIARERTDIKLIIGNIK